MQYALLAEAFRLVDDDVASPQDVDLAVSQGLGLRWSFIGPFETIDLNAPGGVKDYFDRYGDSISRVIKPMDNSRPWTKETVEKIHNAMRAEVPMEKRSKRLDWRNERLLGLAVHKLQGTIHNTLLAPPPPPSLRFSLSLSVSHKYVHNKCIRKIFVSSSLGLEIGQIGSAKRDGQD